MRDFGERPSTVSDDGWWFKGLLLVAGLAITVAHFGLQRSYALERAAVGERAENQITEQDRKELTAIILGGNK